MFNLILKLSTSRTFIFVANAHFGRRKWHYAFGSHACQISKADGYKLYPQLLATVLVSFVIFVIQSSLLYR